MKLKKMVKLSLIFLALTVLFLITGIFSISLFEDSVYISIGFDFGSGSNWTTGWNYDYDYDWVGGLGNTTLLIGFISSLLSLIFFTVFVVYVIKTYTEFSLLMDNKNNGLTSNLKNTVGISDKLDNLILMKAKGHISEEEFKSIKEKIIIEEI